MALSRSLFASRNRLPVDLAAGRCRWKMLHRGIESLFSLSCTRGWLQCRSWWAWLGRTLTRCTPLSDCLSLWTLYFSLQPALRSYRCAGPRFSDQASPCKEAFAHFRCVQLSCHPPPRLATIPLERASIFCATVIAPRLTHSKICPISPGYRFAISQHRPFLVSDHAHRGKWTLLSTPARLQGLCIISARPGAATAQLWVQRAENKKST